MPGIIGWSTKLEHSTSPTPGTWAEVPETVTIQFPPFEANVVEDTHLGVTDRYRTYVAGMRDSGTIDVDMNYSRASLAWLNGIPGVERTWRITAPDEDGTGPNAPPAYTFKGFVSKREPVEFVADQVAKIKFSIKITGGVTFV